MKTWTDYTSDERYKNLGWKKRLEFANLYANKLKEKYPDSIEVIDEKLNKRLEEIDKSFVDFRKSDENLQELNDNLEKGRAYNIAKGKAHLSESGEYLNINPKFPNKGEIIQARTDLEKLLLNDSREDLELYGKDADKFDWNSDSKYIQTKEWDGGKEQDLVVTSQGYVNFNPTSLFTDKKGKEFIKSKIDKLDVLETEKEDAKRRVDSTYEAIVDKAVKSFDELEKQGNNLEGESNFWRDSALEKNWYKHYNKAKGTEEERKREAAIKMNEQYSGAWSALGIGIEQGVFNMTNIPSGLVNSFTGKETLNILFDKESAILDDLFDSSNRSIIDKTNRIVGEELGMLPSSAIGGLGGKGLASLSKASRVNKYANLSRKAQNRLKTIGASAGGIATSAVESVSESTNNFISQNVEIDKTIGVIKEELEKETDPSRRAQLESYINELGGNKLSENEIKWRAVSQATATGIMTSIFPSGMDFAGVSERTAKQYVTNHFKNLLKGATKEVVQESGEGALVELGNLIVDAKNGKADFKEEALSSIKEGLTMEAEEIIATAILGGATGMFDQEKNYTIEEALAILQDQTEIKEDGSNESHFLNKANVIKDGKERGLIRDKSEITDELVKSYSDETGINKKRARQELEGLYDLSKTAYLEQFGLKTDSFDNLKNDKSGVEKEKNKILQEYEETDDELFDLSSDEEIEPSEPNRDESNRDDNNSDVETETTSTESVETKPVVAPDVKTPKVRVARKKEQERLQQNNERAEKLKEEKAKIISERDKLVEEDSKIPANLSNITTKNSNKQKINDLNNKIANIEQEQIATRKEQNLKRQTKKANEQKTKERRAKLDESNKNIEVLQERKKELLERKKVEFVNKQKELAYNSTSSRQLEENTILPIIKEAEQINDKPDDKRAVLEKIDNTLQSLPKNDTTARTRDSLKKIRRTIEDLPANFRNSKKRINKKKLKSQQNDNSNIPTEKADQEEVKQEETLQKTEQGKKDFQEVKAEKRRQERAKKAKEVEKTLAPRVKRLQDNEKAFESVRKAYQDTKDLPFEERVEKLDYAISQAENIASEDIRKESVDKGFERKELFSKSDKTQTKTSQPLPSDKFSKSDIKNFKTLANVAKDVFGANIDYFYDPDSPVAGGKGIKQGSSIRINLAHTEKPLTYTLAHELTHHLEIEHPKLYKDIVDSLIKGKINSNNLDLFLQQRYRHYNPELRFSEFVADSMAEILQNPSNFNTFVDKLTTEQSRSLYKVIKDKIREFIDKLTKALTSDKEVTNLDMIQNEAVVFQEMMQAIDRYENVDNGKDKPFLYVPNFQKTLNALDFISLDQKDHLLSISNPETLLESRSKADVSARLRKADLRGKMKPALDEVFSTFSNDKNAGTIAQMFNNISDSRGVRLSDTKFLDTETGKKIYNILIKHGFPIRQARELTAGYYFRAITKRIGRIRNVSLSRIEAYSRRLSHLGVREDNEGNAQFGTSNIQMATLLGLAGGYKKDLVPVFGEARDNLNKKSATEEFGSATKALIEHLSHENTRDVTTNVIAQSAMTKEERKTLRDVLNEIETDQSSNTEKQSVSINNPVFQLIGDIRANNTNPNDPDSTLEKRVKDLQAELRKQGRNELADKLDKPFPKYVKGSKNYLSKKFMEGVTDNLNDVNSRLEFDEQPVKQKINVVKNWVKKIPADQIKAYINKKEGDITNDDIEKAAKKYLINFDDVLNEETDALIKETIFIKGLDEGKRIRLKKAMRLHVLSGAGKSEGSITESLAKQNIDWAAMVKLNQKLEIINDLELEGKDRSASQLLQKLNKDLDIIFKDNPDHADIFKSITSANMYGGFATFSASLYTSGLNIIRTDAMHIAFAIGKLELSAIPYLIKDGAMITLIKNLISRPLGLGQKDTKQDWKTLWDNITSPALPSGFQDTDFNKIDASRRVFLNTIDDIKNKRPSKVTLKTPEFKILNKEIPELTLIDNKSLGALSVFPMAIKLLTSLHPMVVWHLHSKFDELYTSTVAEAMDSYSMHTILKKDHGLTNKEVNKKIKYHRNKLGATQREILKAYEGSDLSDFEALTIARETLREEAILSLIENKINDGKMSKEDAILYQNKVRGELKSHVINGQADNGQGKPNGWFSEKVVENLRNLDKWTKTKDENALLNITKTITGLLSSSLTGPAGTVSRATDRYLAFTPYGFVRYARAKKILGNELDNKHKAFMNLYSSEYDLNMRLAESIVGSTALTFVIGYVVKEMFDKEEEERELKIFTTYPSTKDKGGGDELKYWSDNGGNEFTVKYKDRYIEFGRGMGQELATAFIVSKMLLRINDRFKVLPEDTKDRSAVKNGIILEELVNTGRDFLQYSFTPLDSLGFLSGEMSGKRLKGKIINMISNPIPFTSFARMRKTYTYGITQKDSENIVKTSQPFLALNTQGGREGQVTKEDYFGRPLWNKSSPLQRLLNPPLYKIEDVPPETRGLKKLHSYFRKIEITPPTPTTYQEFKSKYNELSDDNKQLLLKLGKVDNPPEYFDKHIRDGINEYTGLNIDKIRSRVVYTKRKTKLIVLERALEQAKRENNHAKVAKIKAELYHAYSISRSIYSKKYKENIGYFKVFNKEKDEDYRTYIELSKRLRD